MDSMRRIRLTVSYDGTDFYGWQVQPGRITIQSELQRVFTEIEESPVRVDGSGRTDAGVHAIAQVAAISLHNPIPCQNLRKAANCLLPGSIRIMDAAEASTTFHPRFDAVAKTYEYRIYLGQTCPPFLRNYVYHRPYPTDTQAMAALAPLFQGEHDFSAFAATDTKDGVGRSKVRRVFSSELTVNGDHLLYRVRGRGFLKHMVRNMVGVLFEAGKGNLGQREIEARLRPGSGIPAGPTAPARGLFLVSVEYDGGTKEDRNHRDGAKT